MWWRQRVKMRKKGGGSFINRLLDQWIKEDVRGSLGVSTSPKDVVEQAIRFAGQKLVSKH